MESSTVLAFRIFVMLSCLIIVPMAAIFGSAFPEVVKTVLVDRIVALGGGQAEPAAPAQLGANPAAAGSSVQPLGEATPYGAAPSEAPAWPGSAGGANSPVVAAGAASPYPAAHQSASFSEASGPAPLPAAHAPAAAGEAPRFPSPAQAPDAPGGPVVQAGGAAWQQPEDFGGMERKLREHGAVYYLLETWGSEGEQYRFHCRMAIANNPNYTRHFEATDRDALKAMSQVLSRVEAWRAGRMQ